MAVAKGSVITTEDGRQLLDFLSGAGTLNYGHNPEEIKEALIAYLREDKVIHCLDMMTPTKRAFMETFDALILQPRQFNYKFQFPGPTGANAVEAALKLARRVTGRQNVIAFTNAFHGVSLGALSATGNQHFRAVRGVSVPGVTFFPFDNYLGQELDTCDILRTMLLDSSSGVDAPAAILLETVQGEGGINIASKPWLRRVENICRETGALLIVDDIQMGCGRTGRFFSFEEAGIYPDLVLLSKSLSAYGVPLSLVLVKPEFDVWKPGEHNGTFRGNNLALAAATAALKVYWSDNSFQKEVQRKGAYMLSRVAQIAKAAVPSFVYRGRGMIVGLDCGDSKKAARIAKLAFDRGMIIERCGTDDQVIKLIPPLTILDRELAAGLDILESVALDTVPEADAKLSRTGTQ
jgi:diaminobutyrate-2-oxoglutarate transaminase